MRDEGAKQWGNKQMSRSRDQNISKTTWSTTKSQTLFLASGNLSKLSMLDTGNDAVKYPTKLMLLEPLETRPNRSLTLPSLTTSPAKVLRIPSRRTTTRALSRARVPLLNRRNPHSQPFLETRKRRKANSPGKTAPSLDAHL